MRLATSSAPSKTTSQNTLASSAWRHSGNQLRAPRDSSRVRLQIMLYASQYRSCALTRLALSRVDRRRPDRSATRSASKALAVGSANAATATPYVVKKDGVKKNTQHPIIGNVVLSSASASVAPARLNPARVRAHANARSDWQAAPRRALS